jgi:hypothetical protein
MVYWLTLIEYMKTSDKIIRGGAAVAVFLVLNVPLLFIFCFGWNFHAIYSPLCCFLGVLCILTWFVPSLQRLVFMPGVQKKEIGMRLVFGMLTFFLGAIFI